MEYIIKDLIFKKKENITLCNNYLAEINIHNIFNVEIIIVELVPDESYSVTFYSKNGNKLFSTSDDLCSCYSKYGFRTYKEAYNYANQEMKIILNDFISSVLVDIDDYIEEIGEI